MIKKRGNKVIIKKTNTANLSAHGTTGTGPVDFYLADELPLTITEATDAVKYYFPGDPITFTTTLALKPDNGVYPILDEVEATDDFSALPITLDATTPVVVTGSVVNPTITVTNGNVDITGIEFDTDHQTVTIQIKGKINSSLS